MQTLPCLSLALLLLAAQPAHADVKVIDPQNRTAQELLPVLRPLVTGGGIDVFDGRLVVRGSAAQIAQVEQLLTTLDRPARQLLIQIRSGEDVSAQRDAAEVSGVYRRGDGRIAIPGSDGRLPREPQIELGSEDRRTQRSSTQQVRAEEGREAQIFVGQSIPYTSMDRFADGSRSRRVDFHEATSGFSVIPRVRGDEVQLEIHQRQQLPGPGGVIQVQTLSSVVSGRLGDWFDIGGAVQQVADSSRAVLGGTQSASTQARSLWVRVDPVE